MNLYLVRHGEARSDGAVPERPLTEKGRTEVRKVAAFLSEHAGVRIREVRHSGKLRTEQTAEILADFLSPAEGVSVTDGLEPHADVSTWADRLTGKEEDVLLVGHLPHLARLAGHLLGVGGDKEPIVFRTGGIACLVRNEAGVWSIQWTGHPGALPSDS
jgi:phosphohistidine phosphatase